MVSDAQKKAIAKYQQANYEFIKVRVNKGEHELIRQLAAKEGKSQNQYILDKILGDNVNDNNNK